MLVIFLKVRELIGFKEVTLSEFRWTWFTVFLAVGAVMGVIAHHLFAAVGSPVVGRLGKRCSGKDLRTVWAVASFPIVLGLVGLLSLDILIAGREAYSSPLRDSASSGWAVGSTVFGISVLLWSFSLFVVGLRIVGGLRLRRALVVVVLAVLSLALSAPIAVGIVLGLGTLIGFAVDLVQALTK